MKKLLLAAAIVSSSLISNAASAATCTSSGANLCYITYTNDLGGNFGNPDPSTYPPLFTDVFKFTTHYARTASVLITSSYAGLGLSYNVNFVSNGVKLNKTVIPATSTGVTETRYLANFRLPAGAQQILVTGASAPNGFYNGILTLSGVPETSTWAMMILGIGLAGGALRSRRRQSARLAFA